MSSAEIAPIELIIVKNEPLFEENGDIDEIGNQDPLLIKQEPIESNASEPVKLAVKKENVDISFDCPSLNINRESRFKCHYCIKEYADRKLFLTHIRSHDRDDLNNFGNRSTFKILRIHKCLPTHINIKPYTCNVCNRKFANGVDLNTHECQHVAEKPLVCAVCEKEFAQPVDLKNHKCVHAKDKPQVCNVCGKAFLYPVHLEIHKCLHLGEEPYECQVCNKSFSQLRNLIKHQQVHRGE